MNGKGSKISNLSETGERLSNQKNRKVVTLGWKRSRRGAILVASPLCFPFPRRLQASSDRKPEPTLPLEIERERIFFIFCVGSFLRGRVHIQVVRGVCGWIRAAELAGSGRWGPPAGQRGCWAHRARALTALNSQQPLQVGS